MYEIDVAISEKCVDVDEQFLRDVAEKSLSCEEVAKATISIAVVDHKTIRDLHRRFLEKDSTTDVLSFMLESEYTPTQPSETLTTEPIRRGRGKRIDAEVVVNAEMAAEKSTRFLWQPRDELVLYLIHGLLHAVGYDDLTDPERELMRLRERELLMLWDLTPHYAEESDETSSRSKPGPEKNVSGGDS